MKILKLRLENLASLQGEVEIDFTQPVFADSGIFLITGATGSGKSTLLDAICLALYHRTPRQDRVNKSVNELMTRGASSCMAEVEFVVAGKGYRASFSQRRARDKADGSLQNPQVELAHLAGEVISSAVNDKLADIEKITGLDFERFTRSILLAQGAFATFLQAKPTEMAALLEELTGTEIYARLSEAAYQQARASDAKLKQLNDRLSGVQFLDQTARDALEHALQSALQQVKDAELLGKRRQAEAHAWTTFERLTTELQAIESEWAVLESTLAVHAHEKQTLAMAERAEPVRLAQARVREVQQQWQRNCQEIAQAVEALQACRDDIVTQQARQVDLSQVAVDARSEADRRQHRVHQEIQPLDHALADLNSRLNETRSELTHLDTTQQAETQKGQTLAHRLAVLVEQIDTVTLNIDSLTVPDRWLTDWSGIDALNSQCDQLVTDITALEAQRESDQQALEHLQREGAAKGLVAQETRRALDQSEQQLAEAQQGRDAWMAGRTPESLNASLEAARTQRVKLAGLCQQQTDCLVLQRQKDEAQQAMTTALENAQRQKGEKARCEADLAQARERLQDKQTLRDQQRQILKLEHLRHQLVEGEACPLCGGLDHPYAQQLPELKVDEAEQALNLAAKQMELAHVALQQAIGRVARADADQTSCEAQFKRADLSLEQAQTQWQSACDSAGVVAGIQDQPVLQKALEEADRAVSQADSEIRALLAKEREIQGIRDRLQQQRQDDQIAHAASERVERNITEINAGQTQRQQMLVRNQARYQALRQQLSTQLGEGHLAVEADNAQRNTTLDTLRQRVERRRTLERQKEQWLKEQTDAGRALEVSKTQLKIVSEQAEQTRQKQQQWLNQQSEKLAARAQLLPLEIDTKSWLDQALQASSQADQASRAALEALHVLRVTEAERAARMTQLETFQKEITTQAERVAQTYDDTRNQAGFADDAAFEAACLPESVRQDLKQAVESYAQRRRDLSVRREQKQTEHVSARNGLPENTTPAWVRDALAEANAAHEQAIARQAMLKEQRDADERARNQNASLLRERERLEGEHLWLERLDDLIGSAKGDKFRRFAQGLTLDNLLALANHRLTDLHGRYVLRRREDQELGLEVLDGWQGDAPRDTSTLSGGESFLVSLALALGLSDLVSDRPIDSLFLDEGFGTLDADTLEVALNALDQLHARGKMIGVISHVEALKERIQVQIRLQAASGAGVSRVALPGGN